MSEQQGQKRPPRRRTYAEAEKLVAEYQASGLTQQAFCETRDVSVTMLGRYIARSRAKKSGLGARGESPSLLKVEVARPVISGVGLVVVLSGGRRIEVERGFDAGTFRQLVSALERI